MPETDTPARQPRKHEKRLCSHPGCEELAPYGHDCQTPKERWYCYEHDPCGGRGSAGLARPEVPEEINP